MPNNRTMQTSIVTLAPGLADPVRQIRNVTEATVLDNGALMLKTVTETVVFAPGTWVEVTTVSGSLSRLA